MDNPVNVPLISCTGVETLAMIVFMIGVTVFFVATSILDVSQFVKTLWFMSLCYENFDCSLEFVFSLLLLQPFNFSPVSFACNFQHWGCIILREIDFLLKICWSIPCLHPSWKVHTWLEIGLGCHFKHRAASLTIILWYLSVFISM